MIIEFSSFRANAKSDIIELINIMTLKESFFKIKNLNIFVEVNRVRVKGLEPPSREALDPKSSVSTNFTTPA